MRKAIIDTNSYTRLMSGDENVADALGKIEVVYLSVIVLGEILAGFKGGNREQENKQILRSFLGKPTVEVLDVTSETSEVFAQVKNILRRSGNPIPINDLWIASQAIENGAVIITYDKHFNRIPGLRVWDRL